MGQTNKSNNFIIYNIFYIMTYGFNLMEQVYSKLHRQLKKNTNQITFYFAEEGPGRGSEEDIKKECNVNCFDFFFFSVFLMDVMCGKITVNLKELH